MEKKEELENQLKSLRYYYLILIIISYLTLFFSYNYRGVSKMWFLFTFFRRFFNYSKLSFRWFLAIFEFLGCHWMKKVKATKIYNQNLMSCRLRIRIRLVIKWSVVTHTFYYYLMWLNLFLKDMYKQKWRKLKKIMVISIVLTQLDISPFNLFSVDFF